MLERGEGLGRKEGKGGSVEKVSGGRKVRVGAWRRFVEKKRLVGEQVWAWT